jgi:hypothetical protein
MKIAPDQGANPQKFKGEKAGFIRFFSLDSMAGIFTLMQLNWLKRCYSSSQI